MLPRDKSSASLDESLTRVLLNILSGSKNLARLMFLCLRLRLMGRFTPVLCIAVLRSVFLRVSTDTCPPRAMRHSCASSLLASCIVSRFAPQQPPEQQRAGRKRWLEMRGRGSQPGRGRPFPSSRIGCRRRTPASPPATRSEFKFRGWSSGFCGLPELRVLQS